MLSLMLFDLDLDLDFLLFGLLGFREDNLQNAVLVLGFDLLCLYFSGEWMERVKVP